MGTLFAVEGSYFEKFYKQTADMDPAQVSIQICNLIFRNLHGQLCFVLMYEIFPSISVLPFSRKMMRWKMHILLLHLLVTLM
jgi:uncharacterized membrane protein